MPDIDMDFDERRRGDMIRYATEKYGEERVAQIITYGSIKAKAAIKDSARALGYPFALGERITKAMPPAVMGKDIPLDGIFDPKDSRYSEATEFRALYDADADVRKVVDTAQGLEGLKRQPGVHAAGVILCSEPLLDVIPIWRRDQDGAIITQFDMGVCETLGLLKMDFLGLRNLTVLDDCLRNIASNRGETVVLEELELDDRPTYELLSRGDTLGVFQLDGGPMRALLRSMAPDNFEDISAVLALYRPGPMGANAHNDYADRKNGRKPVEPIHPELAEPLAEILGDTYGLIVYQEQVMAIAQKLAGYSLGAADLLRRAMGKKKKEILDKEFVPFRDGMRANGYSEAAIKTLWEILVPFSDYAFNKAHTAGYGLVSYWTAYLKANYPAEYMAALLQSVKDDKDKSAVYLNECRRMGIKVLPPDVNDSDFDFTPRGTDIRFGLSAVRNVGANVVESLIDARTSQGRFAGFDDFLEKVPIAVVNKRVVESLIKAGAFDSLGESRQGPCCRPRAAHRLHPRHQAQRGDRPGLPVRRARRRQPPPSRGLHRRSRRRSGTRPPCSATSARCSASTCPTTRSTASSTCLSRETDVPVSALHTEDVADGRTVTVGGLVTSVQRKVTKQGNVWAIATLEDLEASIDVMVFPATYQLVGPHVVPGRRAPGEGPPRQERGGGAQAHRDGGHRPRPVHRRGAGRSSCTIPAARCIPPVIDRFKEVLGRPPGRHRGAPRDAERPAHHGGPPRRPAARHPSPALYGDLKALLGPSCLQ